MRTRLLAAIICFGAVLTDVPQAREARLEPPDAGRGHIGVAMRLVMQNASKVYFARLEEGADPLDTDALLPSNYTKGKNVYLLNALPGRYVAVGLHYEVRTQPSQRTSSFTVLLARDAILSTEVSVAPGHPVFMGDLKVKRSERMRDADPAQNHFFRLIEPEAARRGDFARGMRGETAFGGVVTEVERGTAEEKEFWAAAVKRHFDDEPAWLPLIEGRLAELGS